MCFTLYLGARIPPPLADSGQGLAPGRLPTRALRECDAAVRSHFTLPHVVYIGSDTGCGCNYRHASFQQGGWPEEEYPDPAGVRAAQPSHESLVAFIRQHFGGEDTIELYGCWAGDEAMPELDRRELQLAELRSPTFFFRHSGFCRVRLNGRQTG